MDSTAYVNVTVSNKQAENRTSPVYVAELGKLSLQDILEKKPDDFNKQIDISWISDALNKKAMEVKYAPWDAVPMIYGLWCASAYGNNTIIAATSDGNTAYSSDFCKSFKEYKVCDNITGITFGDNIFAISSYAGKIYISEDMGQSYKEITYENYDFTSIAYNKGTFLLGTACGKIFATMDKFNNFTKIAEYSESPFTKILYVNNIIIALSSNESNSLIYSTDFGAYWHSFNLPFSQGASITYGKGKFVVCAIDCNKISICLEKDILEHKAVWQRVTMPKDDVFSDISFGADVFVLISLQGTTMASYDGITWIETMCPEGSWANLLRTDYFFTAFSISENKDNLYAAKSSNGGLAGIMFASLEEVISDENVNKSINPYTLKDYLKYRTGKENGKYPVYSDDLLIECTSMDTRQIKITNISQDSSIENFDNIKTAGIYIIEKKLTNAPFESDVIYMLVQKNEEKIYQFAGTDYNFNTGCKREYNNNWQMWEKVIISEKDIEINEESTFLENSHILMNNEKSIRKVHKNDLFANIITSLLEHGKTYKWVDSQNYTQGALILGSDSCLYYCLQDNGAELSKIYDPVSSPDYWVKIINSEGKIMADNLSVILGSFALLNELSINDEKLKDILSVNKGGTGSDNFQGAANNILKDAAEATTMADSEFLYIYSGGNVKKLSLSSLNNILKASLPTGFIYIQLRGQSTPDVLFNTTGKWQDISSTYAGEFFRAVGGNSASFGSKQNEGLPTFNIVTDRAVQGQGKVLPKGVKLTSANKGLGGMASTQGYGGTSAVAIGTENTSFSQSPFPYFVPNNSIYGASTHVTPYNSAIRIWKKIS